MIAFLSNSPQLVALVVLGFILSLATGIGIGGNDIANFFGTAVGTKTLTLLQVIILASIFELAGSMLLGEHVTDSVRKGSVDLDAIVSAYQNSTTCLKPFTTDDSIFTPLPDNYRGCSEMIVAILSLSALFGSATWLAIANYFRLPVSTTHSIVGATFGAGLVALEGSTANWKELGAIVASWIVSPILSGLISLLIYWLIFRYVLSKEESFKIMLTVLPYFYFCTIFIYVFSIVYNGTPVLGFDKIPWWGVLILSTGLGAIVAILTVYVFNGMLIKRIDRNIARVEFSKSSKKKSQDSESESESNSGEDEDKKSKNSKVEDGDNSSHSSHSSQGSKHSKPELEDTVDVRSADQSESDSNDDSDDNSDDESDDESDNHIIVKEAKDVRTNYLFQNLQIMMGCFGTFVHGGNDISNAISPLLSIWFIFKDNLIQSKVNPPLYLLFYGACAVVIGLSTIGYGVIYTIGKNIAQIAPSSAFCIQFGPAFTVLLATRLNIPVSTTHCQIGSVVAVGLYRNGRSNLNKRILLSIALSWVLTLPIAGVLAAIMFAGARQAFFTYNVGYYV